MRGIVSRAIPGPTVLWAVPGSLHQATGGYRYDARIVAGLRARGYQTHVLELGLRCWPVDPLAAARLARQIGGAFDVVVVDELAHPAAAVGVPLARALRRLTSPLVLVVHHLRCSEPGPTLVRHMARVVERAALGRADLVVTTSQTTAEAVRALVGPALETTVVEPGSDPIGRSRPRRPPVSANALRVLSVAHWTPRKRILDALAAIARAPTNVTLDLVGDSERDPAYAGRVRRALRDPALVGRVRVHGRVSDTRLRELYLAADAFVHTAAYEGYGMVIGEALQAGLPIVATRAGAVPEIVGDREAILVAPGDVGALADALTRLAADPDERACRSAYSLERASHLPSWRDACDQFAWALDRLVEGRRSDTVLAGSW